MLCSQSVCKHSRDTSLLIEVQLNTRWAEKENENHHHQVLLHITCINTMWGFTRPVLLSVVPPYCRTSMHIYRILVCISQHNTYINCRPCIIIYYIVNCCPKIIYIFIFEMNTKLYSPKVDLKYIIIKI